MSSLADRYERRYPGTGISEAHKEERQERHDLKAGVRSGRRSTRLRGIVIPASAAFDTTTGRLRP